MYGRFDEIGYDAFEVINTGYMAGSGEDGYLHPYMCASDGHRADFVGSETNVIFVKNPSGPNGSITANDIMDAVRNKRIVLVSRTYNLLYGQEVWVNRYLEEIQKANETVQNTKAYLDALAETTDIGIAGQYIDAAEDFNYWWINPMRAIRYANMANSSVAQSIKISVEYDNTIKPNSDFEILVYTTNNNTSPISYNATIMKQSFLPLNEQSHLVEVGAETQMTTEFLGTAGLKGFGDSWIIISSFNTTVPLGQLMLGGRILIQNVTYLFTSVDNGISVDVSLNANREAVNAFKLVTINFNDGTTSDSIEMEAQYSSFLANIGTYEQGTNITISIEAVDNGGVHYNLDEMEFTVESGGTTPAPTGEIDPMMMIIIAGAIVGVVIVVGVIIKIKKS